MLHVLLTFQKLQQLATIFSILQKLLVVQLLEEEYMQNYLGGEISFGLLKGSTGAAAYTTSTYALNTTLI